MKYSLFLRVIVCCALVCAQNVLSVDANVQQLAEYVKGNGQEPIQYILSKFEDHDVVILSEYHYIKDDPVLVNKLIPILHKNGINIMVTEHAREEDQYLIDSLLSSKVYDESLAMKINFLEFVHWPFKEYIDNFRAAWETNQNRDANTPPFRILGGNCSTDWSVMKKPEDFKNPEFHRAVWGGCTEEGWAKVVLNAVAEGDKVLVYCGYNHGLTKYHEPRLSDDGQLVGFNSVRMGNYVYNELGDRVMNILLHKSWDDTLGVKQLPANGCIDRTMKLLGPDVYPVGFDVPESPLSKIVLTNCKEKYGYEPFTLDKYCDGYIFTRPFSEMEAVSLIDGFVTEENLEEARNQTPNPKNRTFFTVEEYYEEFRRDLKGLEELWHSLTLEGE